MVQTKNIYLRLIQEEDVDFLLKLRLNQNLNKYLNVISNDRNQQLNWLKDYKIREASGTDYYFVIVDKKNGDVGLVRVYDINYMVKSFRWGSWIITEEDRPKYAAIESAILSFEFAFNELNLKLAYIDVVKENIKADNFYKRFGLEFSHCDELNKYYILNKNKYLTLKYNQYYTFLIF